MARKRSGGGTAYAVSLVIFVILFVFSLLIAILLYTQVNSAEQRANQARIELAKVITPSEKTTLDTELANRPRDKTVVGQLLEDTRRLKQRIINTPTATLDQINAEISAVNVAESQSLLQEIKVLRATQMDSQQQVKLYKDAAAGAEEKLKAKESERAAAIEEKNRTVEDLRAQLVAIEARHKQYETTVAQQRKTLEQQLAEVREQGTKAGTDLRSQLDQKNQEVETIRHRLNEIERKFVGIDKTKPLVDPSLLPDGKIASIISEQGLVYIDRGRKDRILPGLTFEIFDRMTGVTKNEVGDIRGKATIEVINVGENSSVARIVRTARNKSVAEGDLIVNAIYDPNLKFRFVVFGEFDIDSTGQPTISDRRRIETLVTDWGGILSDELTFDSDFLILGQEPRLPEPLSAKEMDPQVIERHTAQTRRYKQYQDLVANAKALAIPILNQNRFLSLVGYYRR